MPGLGLACALLLVLGLVCLPSGAYGHEAGGLQPAQTAAPEATTPADLPLILQDGTYTYVYGHGLISQTDSAGAQTYLLADGLGSTATLTDAAGTVTGTHAYDVFGAVRSSTGTASSEYRYTGQQDEAALGLTYLRARYYDQSTGRFLSKDPFPGLDVAPPTQHHYTYTVNNPVNLADPSGKFPPLLIAAAVIAWGALEAGSTAVDAYNTIQTLNDPCATPAEKMVISGLFFAGLGAPGGGYATGGRFAVRNAND